MFGRRGRTRLDPFALVVWAGGGLLVAVIAVAAALEFEGRAQRRRGLAERDRAIPARATAPESGRASDGGAGDGDYLGSESCRACHPEPWSSWHRSWHRTMTQAVSADTVIADFAAARLVHADGEHRVETRPSGYFVYMPEASWLLARAQGREHPADAPFAWQRVVMSTGAHHMQMYWVAAEPGRRLVAFPFSWVVEARRWVPNEATLLRPFEREVVYEWNTVCIKCHAVAGEARAAPADPSASSAGGVGSFDTRVAELGIACEACHGPGARHAAQMRDPIARYRAHFDDAPPPAIENPARMDASRSAEVCAQCHAASLFADPEAWLARGSHYRPGRKLEEAARVVRHPVRADQPFIEATLDEDPDYLAGRFWGDGMIRISGRDYNGLIESPCAVDPDFDCLSCHEMHGDEPEDQLNVAARADGDGACLACHEAFAESDARAEHTRHAEDSPGARCVACHMPRTVYGLTKAIRSHQISSPNVDESVDLGRPNACNLCHLDQRLAWTAEHLASDHGLASSREQLDALEGGLRTRAAAVAWLTEGDAGQRALAAEAFGRAEAQRASGRGWMVPLLLGALEDEYAAVRWIALRSLRSLPGLEDLDWAFAGPELHEAAKIGARAAEARAEVEVRRAGGSLRALEAAPRDAAELFWAGGSFDREGHRAARARRDTRRVDLRE